jgi:glycosyltransferase involved in cell wall biosynthesis
VNSYKFKLAIITTHPIQYYSPIFQLLARNPKISLRVFYTWNRSSTNNFDHGFGKAIEWDIPLLEGYEYIFVQNTSQKPGSHHFMGMVNPTLETEIQTWGAQAVLIFGWSYYSYLKIIRSLKGKIPVFFRGDSHLLNEKVGLKTFARRVLLRWIYSNVDYAFYVGQNNKQYYLTHGLKEDQLTFAPHAIDNMRFMSNADIYHKDAMEWRKAMGIKENSTIYLFAGKFEPKKNPLLLLKSFIALENTNAYLIFVGNGILEEELKRIAASYPNIHFLDFQNQTKMPIVYRLGNVFVLPSQGPGETWGLAVNEAMACGLPVIISDKVGCGVDLVKNKINGYIFKSENMNELTDAMRNFVNSQLLLRKMGEESRSIIQEWSIQAMVESIEKAILHAQ